MGSNFRRDDSDFCNFNDDEPDDFFSRVKRLLRALFQFLFRYIPFIIVGIISIIIAFFAYNQYSSQTIRDIESDICDLKETISSRMDDIENAVIKLAASCGSSTDQGDDDEKPDESNLMEELIKKHLRKYDADKTGMIDWALESLGGRIISTKGTESHILQKTSILGIPCSQQISDPNVIIRPSTMPGDCWAFKGEGTVLIKLVTVIYVTNITIEHIPQEMSLKGNMDSAPKKIMVFGYCESKDKKATGSKHCFGTFEYKSGGDTIQTFPVTTPFYAPIEIMEFIFKSNHGNPDFTCVYRVRVHGSLEIET